jgi:hypothetical protein
MRTRYKILPIIATGIIFVFAMNNGHDLFHYMGLPYEWHDSFGFTDRNIIRSTQCASEELGWLEPCNDVIVSDNTSEQLEGIFASCACQKRVKANPETNNLCTQPLIDWENSTHYIDNNICKFMTHEEYEHDTSLKNALKKCWVGNSEYLEDDFVLWSNETHFINTETCLITEAKNEN